MSSIFDFPFKKTCPLIAIGDRILRRDTNRTRFFSLSEKKKEGGSITGEKSFPSAGKDTSVEGSTTNRIEKSREKNEWGFCGKRTGQVP